MLSGAEVMLPMNDDLPDFSRMPEDSAKGFQRLGIGAFVVLLALLFLAVVYSVGEKLEDFRWSVLFNGMASFLLITTGVCLVIAAVLALFRGLSLLIPAASTQWAAERRLKKARRAAADAVAEKHRLNEERARLTAQLKATFLFEQETTQTANARVSREFREALQSSVMRSCQIAFDQINQLVDQYEQVLREIDSSSLPAAEKTDLLQTLTDHLNVAAAEERNRDAQKLMESEIWKVRFKKARLMADEKSEAAVQYLKTIRKEARTANMKSRISAMIESLTEKSQ